MTAAPAKPAAAGPKPSVIEALSRVMESVRSVAKTGRNQQQGFVFRGIDAVMNAVGPKLREHGVVIIPEVLEHTISGSQTTKGSAINVCRVRVKYVAYGPAGDSISGVVPAEAMDSGDKATAKAMSVAYRTFLLQALTLPTDEPDPDESSYDASHDDGQDWSVWITRAAPHAGNRSVLHDIWVEAQAAHAPRGILNQIEALVNKPPVRSGAAAPVDPPPPAEDGPRDFIGEIDNAYPNPQKLTNLLEDAKKARDTAAVKSIEAALAAALAEATQEAQR